MNNFDVPLTANTQTESHVLHMSRDKWIMNKNEIYFVRVKISFKISFASGCRQNSVFKKPTGTWFSQLNIVKYFIEMI